MTLNLASASNAVGFIFKAGRHIRRADIFRFQCKIHQTVQVPGWSIISLFRPSRQTGPIRDEHISRACQEASISIDEFKKWKRLFFNAEDLSAALFRLFVKGSKNDDQPNVMRPTHEWDDIPEWVVMHLLWNQVRTRSCAAALGPFFRFRLIERKADLRPSFLMTTYNLSAWVVVGLAGNGKCTVDASIFVENRTEKDI